ncbi:MAG: NAD(P)/FAD-dependent oxidoreductase [Oscillospiraceae bacterium]|nr:NAD(P)/FAD-dependent oxidoreductase [Oscillospiraceae bacterium]
MYDIIIIGAGVSGSSIARELAKFDAKICVVERCEDVCCGTSKANSAIVHAGYDAKTGTLMARLDVEGSYLIPQLARDLDFSYRNNGSLVLCMHEEDLPALHELYNRGRANGVSAMRLLTREEVLALEPNVQESVVAGMEAGTGGIVCPFGMNIAFAENAAENGVEFRFDTQVTGFERTREGWDVQTNRGTLSTRIVINAAGVYADLLHNMVSEKKIHITPRRGDYYLLDRTTGGYVSHALFQLPSKYGKGVLVAPTVHGNTIVGPTAIDIDDRDGVNTTAAGLEEVMQKASIIVKDAPLRQVITSFAGLRAHEDGHEFIIGEVEDAPGFIDCAGIESPGLSSSPAIGKMVAEIVRDKLPLRRKAHYKSTRKGVLNPATLSFEERQALIRENPAYGNVICRCEGITEGEILDAIHRPLGARSLDGIKRRVRAGMGRCQGGFCAPRVMEILAREWNLPMDEISKCGGSSQLIVGINKDRVEGGPHHGAL